MLNDVVSSIFTPGTNPGLLRAIDFTFYALFATLVLLLVVSDFNLHVVILLFLAVCLFVSLKWVLVELNKIQSAGIPSQSLDTKPDKKES